MSSQVTSCCLSRATIISIQIKKPEENHLPVIKASISDKKVSNKMEPSKDFGSFSALLAPALLTGKTTATTVDDETLERRNRSSASDLLSANKFSSSTSNLSSSKYSSSSQVKTDRKEESSYNYSSTFQDKHETNNNFGNNSSSFSEDNNNVNK